MLHTLFLLALNCTDLTDERCHRGAGAAEAGVAAIDLLRCARAHGVQRFRFGFLVVSSVLLLINLITV